MKKMSSPKHGAKSKPMMTPGKYKGAKAVPMMKGKGRSK